MNFRALKGFAGSLQWNARKQYLWDFTNIVELLKKKLTIAASLSVEK